MQPFVLTKNFFRAAILGASVLATGPVLAQGEDCAGIDSDVAQMECFDASNNENVDSSPGRDEALLRLFEIVEYKDQETLLVLGAREGTCEIEAILKYVSIWPGGELKPYIIRSFADLSKVERVEGWGKGEEVHYGANLIYERGFEGSWIRRQGSVVQSNQSVETLNESNMKVQQRYQGRDARFYILLRDYLPDADLVQAALEDAIAACQQ